ncbi:hypothetical protein Tco_1303413 [Tanacetum coccineum]
MRRFEAGRDYLLGMYYGIESLIIIQGWQGLPSGIWDKIVNVWTLLIDELASIPTCATLVSDHGSEPWEKPIHKHDQVVHIRRYLQRETPKRLFPWNSRKKNWLQYQPVQHWYQSVDRRNVGIV